MIEHAAIAGTCQCGVCQFVEAHDRMEKAVSTIVDQLTDFEGRYLFLVDAVRKHRTNIMLLGHRPDERTGEPVWGGQFDRDLWAALGEGYPTRVCTCDFDPSYSGGLCDVCGLPEAPSSSDEMGASE